MTNELRAAFATVLMAGMISGPALGQTTTTTTTKRTTTQAKKKAVAKKAVAPKESVAEEQVRELREEMRTQNEALKAQIAALQAASAAKDAQLAAAQSQAADASATAQATVQQLKDNKAQMDTINTTVGDLKIANVGLATTISTTKQELTEKIDSPTQLHYKGITITPVAFFAFEGVWRQHSVNSDINTPFTTIPFPDANEYHQTELNFSGRQSRLGGLFEGNSGKYKLSGYFEADFLGAGATSNNNQSNSYVLRQRQIWGKAETAGGFAVTGGQMWSLVTETGKGVDNRTEKLPQTIDPQYMVGFSWTRQPALRVSQRFGDPKKAMFTAAMSVEQAQLTSFTASGSATPTNFIFAGSGVNGGLYNAFNGVYLNAIAPDVVVKGTLDLPKAHFELGGIARFFRDTYYPLILSSTGATTGYNASSVNNTKTGGGIFGSARVSASKYVDVALQVMAGQGVGRYGSAQLADATIHPDGTLEPLRNYHGLGTIETHPTKNLDVFGYYGGEYAQRTVYTGFQGGANFTGYGAQNLSDAGCKVQAANSTGNTGSNGSDGNVNTCASPVRYVQEGMIGFTYRVVNSPKYGRLQYSATYQILEKQLWSGLLSGTYGTSSAVFTSPKTSDGMIHVGMRYYIP